MASKLIEMPRPPVRPLFFDFEDPRLFGVQLQFMIGSGLLVAPCVEEGETSVQGHLSTINGTTPGAIGILTNRSSPNRTMRSLYPRSAWPRSYSYPVGIYYPHS